MSMSMNEENTIQNPKKGAKSKLRGVPIYWDGFDWRYCDSNELSAETWGDRPCGHCGLYGNSNDGKPDPCLGQLPGVTNACCGHGNPNESYVVFEGGVVLRGFHVST